MLRWIQWNYKGLMKMKKKKTEEQLLYNRERNVVNKLGHLDIPF